ncbi:MAG: DUF2130 domain-containing protein [Chthoniobacterales bacterium]
MKNEPDEIVIKLSEEISCPFDTTHGFALRQGLQESTIRQMLQNLAQQRGELKTQLEAALRQEFEAQAEIREQELKKQNEILQGLLGDVRDKLAKTSQSELRLKENLDRLKLEHAVATEKAVANARETVRAEATFQAERVLREKFEGEMERLKLKQAELEKQRDDALRTAEELKRRMEQGSQQAQGEVLELALEKELPIRFAADQITPVAKGVYGADVLQAVISPSGQICGSITWETKNAQNWNSKWIEKLRQDMIANKSEFAVLVSTVLPPGIRHFGQLDGIWVCDLSSWPALATVLRLQVLNLAAARASAEGRDQKMNVLYKYLTGPEFRERVNAVMQTFVRMQEQLNREKRAIIKHWNTREKQIQTVLDGIAGIYGDLQGIIGKTSLPEIETLELAEGEEEMTNDR